MPVVNAPRCRKSCRTRQHAGVPNLFPDVGELFLQVSSGRRIVFARAPVLGVAVDLVDLATWGQRNLVNTNDARRYHFAWQPVAVVAQFLPTHRAAHEVGKQFALIVQSGSLTLQVADLPQDAANAIDVDIVVQFVKRLLSGFVSQSNVPAVWQRIVVIAALLLVDIDARIVDQAVCRPPGILRPYPGCPIMQERVDVLQRHVPITIKIHKPSFGKDFVIGKYLDVENPRNRVFHTVVDFSGLDDLLFDARAVKHAMTKQVVEPRFEDLSPRQTRDNAVEYCSRVPN